MTPRPVVLASASPRRRQLLGALGVVFAVRPADVDEAALAAGLEPARAAAVIAEAKARAVAGADAVVLAADTVVAIDGRVLGKPVDAADARGMLRALRGRRHEVLTAVAVASAGTVRTAVRRSEVVMRAYTDVEIDAYVRSGAALDKAGAYGIQDEAFAPVATVAGCWCNVVGLPVWTAWRLLAAAGAPPPLEPGRAAARCAACPLAAGEPEGDASAT